MKKAIAIALSLLYLGCGGGGGSSSDVSDSLKTASATYVDSPVSGVEYQCGSVSGITNDTGGFIYEVGKDCIFKVGGINFKTIKSYELEDGKVILENSSVIAAFLQTLDVDGDPSNGITITKEVRDKLKDVKITALSDDSIENIYNELKTLPTYSGKYYTKTEALLNLIQSQTNLIKSMISSKTLYNVSSDSNGVNINKVYINSEANAFSLETGESLGMNINGNLITFDNNITAMANIYKNKISLTYMLNTLPVFSEEMFFNESDAKTYANELKSGEYLKALIAGKVFYQVFQNSDGSLVLNKVTINNDASAGMFSAVDGSRFGGTFAIKISGNILNLHIDGVNIDYKATFLGKNDNMLILAPSKNEVNIASYMFFDESYARKVLDSLVN